MLLEVFIVGYFEIMRVIINVDSKILVYIVLVEGYGLCVCMIIEGVVGIKCLINLVMECCDVLGIEVVCIIIVFEIQ